MKPNPSVSSSDLERARSTAGRLVAATPGAPVPVPEKPEEYVRFSASALGIAPSPPRPVRPPAPPPPAPPVPPTPIAAPAWPAPKVSPPPPEPTPFAVAPPRFEPPPAPPKAEVKPKPAPPPPPLPPPAPPRVAAPPKSAPPPPPRPPAPEPEPEPELETGMNDSIFEMDETPSASAADDGLGVLEDELPEEVGVMPPSNSSIDFEEDIAGVAAAAVTGEVEPEPALAEPARTWAEILDDAIYLAHARCALVMDGTGQVHESRGDWPKNTLEKVAARLLRGIEQAPPTDPEASQLVEIQLGSFWLTGLRVQLGGSPAIVGFLSQAPIKREVRPGIESEVRRGSPL
jgi:hypothetical protein